MKDTFRRLRDRNLFILLVWNIYRLIKGRVNILLLDDLQAIKKLYYNYSGVYPNIDKPRSFSEKQQWLKLNYHNNLMTTCADKWEVRDYVLSKGYPTILSRVFGVYDSFSDIPIEELPNKFVIKATHGSGWNLICHDKNDVNWFWWRKIMGIWLRNNIFWPGREWPYKNMKPRLLVEEYLEDSSGFLQDYKFFCFSGKTKFIQVNRFRGSENHVQNFYDLQWNLLEFGKSLTPDLTSKITPPKNLVKMISIAENLSDSFPFARVDLYEVESNVYFGEMTFYPKSGLPDFRPASYDQIVGDYLDLPDIQNQYS